MRFHSSQKYRKSDDLCATTVLIKSKQSSLKPSHNSPLLSAIAYAVFFTKKSVFMPLLTVSAARSVTQSENEPLCECVLQRQMCRGVRIECWLSLRCVWAARAFELLAQVPLYWFTRPSPNNRRHGCVDWHILIVNIFFVRLDTLRSTFQSLFFVIE